MEKDRLKGRSFFWRGETEHDKPREGVICLGGPEKGLKDEVGVKKNPKTVRKKGKRGLGLASLKKPKLAGGRPKTSTLGRPGQGGILVTE